jgi:hypothetical protein
VFTFDMIVRGVCFIRSDVKLLLGHVLNGAQVMEDNLFYTLNKSEY